ncbi:MULTISPECIES: KAP family NTPase [Idiomarina]|jgi:hypothetical protein|uniref:KAP family NTPase n=1 Tax=Idiomarina TaxID=135575 RepID=UPI000C42615D|nr:MULTISPECIES: KAP family NTPase [Idiomarina]MBP59524.1 AAA family ATPase [Idiomarina sp.]|tara:strand:+ start:10322 stop:11677 length:1356 start_codon:yes stop_codon:yes gene_type:complete
MANYKTFDSRDEFNRRSIAENIIKLIDAGEFTPMLLNGPWGSGKTEFSQKLISLINDTQEDWRVAYIDAFKADHSDEPLITLIAAIAKLLPTKDGEQNRFIAKALPTIKFGLKTTAKAAVAHMTRESFDDVSSEYQKAIGEALNHSVDATIESMLKEHVEAEKNLEMLQSSLHEISKERALVLIVDELDRCRPDFAIDIIELIKHVFDVENVHFILVTNTKQLKAAINHRYGSQVDAQRYLDKFLKVKVQIPAVIPKQAWEHESINVKHFRSLVQADGKLAGYGCHKENDMRFKLFSYTAKHYGFSLREIETFVRNLSIFILLSNEKNRASSNFEGEQLFEFVGLLVSTFNPELAYDIVEGRGDSEEFSEYFMINKPRVSMATPLEQEIQALLHAIAVKLDKNLTGGREIAVEKLEKLGVATFDKMLGSYDIESFKSAVNIVSLRTIADLN